MRNQRVWKVSQSFTRDDIIIRDRTKMFCYDIMITLVADAKLRWNAKRGCHPTSACATPISGASNRESGFFVGGLSIHQWTIHQCLIGQSSAMQFNGSSYLHLVFPGLLAKDSIEQLKYLIGKAGWVLRAKRLLISTNIFPRGRSRELW